MPRRTLSFPPLQFALPHVPGTLRVGRPTPLPETPTVSELPRLLAVGRVRLAGDKVLTVGDAAPGSCAWLDLAGGAAEAAEVLRRLVRLDRRPDLVLVGPRLDPMPSDGHGQDGRGRDEGVWPFVRRLREGWPWLAWALVAAAGEVTPRGERYALAQGALAVLDGEREFGRLLDLARSRRVEPPPPTSAESAAGRLGC